MKKQNLPLRAWKELQRNTASKESHDVLAAMFGAWWALRRAEKSERKMIEAFERIAETEEAIARARRGETSSITQARFSEASSPPSLIASAVQRQTETTDGDGAGKYVVLYGLLLVLRPLLTCVLYIAMLWGLWNAFLWLFLS